MSVTDIDCMMVITFVCNKCGNIYTVRSSDLSRQQTATPIMPFAGIEAQVAYGKFITNHKCK